MQPTDPRIHGVPGAMPDGSLKFMRNGRIGALTVQRVQIRHRPQQGLGIGMKQALKYEMSMLKKGATQDLKPFLCISTA